MQFEEFVKLNKAVWGFSQLNPDDQRLVLCTIKGIQMENKIGTGTFDYVAYDGAATEVQALFKSTFQQIHADVDIQLKSPRAKSLVKTKLEEAYMWVGKAIRDDQITRNGSAPLQESRNNS